MTEAEERRRRWSGRSSNAVGMRQVAALTLVMVMCIPCCRAWNCSTSSRDALLEFKDGLVDNVDLFSTWTTSLDCCLWQFVTCRESDGAVITLSITGSSASGQQPFKNTSATNYTLGSTLVDLDQLETLKIQWVLFNGDIPSRWSSFSNNLVSLTVNDANLRGDIPSSIANIDNLQRLDLSSNHITGDIPSSLCDNSHLTYIDVSYNDMDYNLVPTCLQDRNGINITVIYNGQGSSTSPGSPGTSAAAVSRPPAALLLTLLASVLLFLSLGRQSV